MFCGSLKSTCLECIEKQESSKKFDHKNGQFGLLKRKPMNEKRRILKINAQMNSLKKDQRLSLKKANDSKLTKSGKYSQSIILHKKCQSMDKLNNLNLVQYQNNYTQNNVNLYTPRPLYENWSPRNYVISQSFQIQQENQNQIQSLKYGLLSGRSNILKLSLNNFQQKK